MWHFALGRRIEINQWSMDSRHPERREFYQVAERNIDCARVRLAVEQARLRTGPDEGIRNE